MGLHRDHETAAWGRLADDRAAARGPPRSSFAPAAGLTVVTGLVDAFSYLVLGHVFVANMTGNVVFLGFALAGAKGFSIAASALAIASFGLGALIGGRIGSWLGRHRGVSFSTSAGIQALFFAT